VDLPDLTALGLAEFLGLLLLISAFDVIAAYVASIVQGVFSLGAVAIYIQSHVLKRVFPIFAMAVLGQGIPQFGVPEIPVASLAAVAFLGTYALETIASIRGSFTDASRPADTTPAR
jgi:hypothetical protein